MDDRQFDRFTRRIVVGGFAAVLGGGAAGLPHQASAGKRKKRLKRNEFGCVNVGGKCRGKGQHCCSGICNGKKPKQGEKDTSRCVAHDAGVGCRAGDHEAGCDGAADISCTTSTGSLGVCDTTTGNAGICIFGFSCFPCRKDEDCQKQGCGPRASCVRCQESCPHTGGTACVRPDTVNCP
jgi:hypothetical protein